MADLKKVNVCPHCGAVDRITGAGMGASFFWCSACGGGVPKPIEFSYRRRIQTTIRIDYGVIEDIVHRFYSRPDYSFVATEECGNDTLHSFTVNPAAMTRYDREQMELFRAGESADFSNYDVLNALCVDRFLDPGKYIVEVCW
ncbi:MAG: hypothetical protein AMS22_06300 [Thiotrichales bacterium SG8_50]|nr:MAG: hypothetical protein AMS22_06300 [Thiotrichales bacterium SG8_50]